MSDSSALPKSCPQCGAALPSEATEGLCPRCILSQAMQSAPKKGPWQPPTAEELAKLLPQYDITRMLGRGGMGAVYQGTQKSLDRPVAIKILPAEMDDQDASFAERFKNEARAMAKLTHPGIVAVYDSGETADGMLYIVMEFIEGTDVARMIAKQKRLHTEHAMAITAHVCDALAYAHERGIIHRDIKPANIMVGYDGVVKVADFGLAKMSKSGESGLTQSGMAMGTLYYMAPEALMLGTAVDHRADIYAVGVMLYQMLTGKLPQGLFELPSLQVPGLDPRYDGIIGKALREDRELRYPSTQDMRHDLDAILTQPVVKVEAAAEKAPAALETQARPQRPAGQPYRPPQRSTPPPPKKKSQSGLILAVLGVLAVIAAAFFFLRDKGGDSPFAEVTQEKPFINTLGMKFVPVPGTSILMCIHETRRQDYAAYAAEVSGVNGAWMNQKNDGVAVGDRDDHPVVAVSWDDAQAFCAWLSKKDGRTYRLPTDKEWSHAVGLGSHEQWTKDSTPKMFSNGRPNDFPWGTDFPPKSSDLVGNYADLTWQGKFPAEEVKAPKSDTLADYSDGFPTTAPVMSFKPNKLGIYDLGGNVWEWCADWYDGTREFRVLRGGGWRAWYRGILNSSCRDRSAPNYRFHGNGFRVVLEVSAPVVAAAATEKPHDPQPARVTKDASFTNTLGMKFVPVPDTKVLFCIHETRRQDYAAFAAENPTVRTSWSNAQMDGVPVGDKDDHPVVSVSWGDAAAFCAWLSKKEGRSYRLPTDREWSFAVGIGHDEQTAKDVTPADLNLKTPHFPWGSQWPPPKGAGNYADTAWKEKFPTQLFAEGYTDGFPTTSPVMSFAPNTLGLYDLGGNVWEWCEDWFDATQKARVTRGGSWTYNVSANMRSSNRNGLQPDQLNPGHGFRVVLEVSEPAPTTPVAATEKPLDPQLARATTDQPFANTLGMKFVPVPDTKVLFCIHETRWKDYAAYASEAPGVDDTWKNQSDSGFTPTDRPEDHPVMRVSWEDAQKFCTWLSQKEGKAYRLPTDREWSFAVGIGAKEPWTKDTTPEMLNIKVNNEFPWGGDFPPQTAGQAGNYADLTYHEKFLKLPCIESYADGFTTTAPVMSFKTNAVGIYDLGGNVWEWCDDRHNGSANDRVLRGAGWGESIRHILLSSVRIHHPPGFRDNHRGFRVVLESSTPAAITQTTLSPSPTGPTTWTDTQGRSLQATFKAIVGGNVLLEIAGKIQPVALNTLSAASQKLARDYQQQPSATVPKQDANTERRAAEWVLANGGTIKMVQNGSKREIKTALDLPASEFKGIEVSFAKASAKPVNDASIANIAPLTGIELLELDHQDITDEALQHLVGMSELRYLSLYDCPKITGPGLQHLTSLKHLRLLILHGARVGDAGYEHIGRMTQLDTLNLTGLGATDAGIRALSGLKQLRSLVLNEHKLVTDDALQTIAKFPALEELYLEACPLTDAGIGHLQGCARLGLLNINGTQITSASLAMLGRLPHLRSLLIRRTAIHDADLAKLGSPAELESLDLADCPLTDACMTYLGSLKRLRSVALNRTQVTDAGVAKLQAAIPGLKVTR